MARTSIKVAGASGQGINSVGGMIAKGLKRAGHHVFGYREYPSLIKGGHASYQVDASDSAVQSTQCQVDALLAINHHALQCNLGDLKEDGVVLHTTADWRFTPQQQHMIDDRRLAVIHLPADRMLRDLGAGGLMSNTLLLGFLWSLLDQDVELLGQLMVDKFEHKPSLVAVNSRCIDAGYAFTPPSRSRLHVRLPAAPSREVAGRLLLTGSEAMGLGALHAGMRMFASYPMTPASPLLSFFAKVENKTHIVLKQAEDEITAAQMVSGAMYMGTRALAATSGAGFDLMSETLSMNAMTETPAVFVLAQRPGPSTGLATWTAQGDLLLAVSAGHGEYPRCVLAVSDSQDAFDLMPVAFNIADRYQVVVVVLTEKQIADGLYTQPPYDQDKACVDRGRLVIGEEAQRTLNSSDRYDPHAADGVSLRWAPGSKAATFCAQADEHDATGSVAESAHDARLQMDKRMRKAHALRNALPEPSLHLAGAPTDQATSLDLAEHLDLLIVSWGSNRGVIVDVMGSAEIRHQPVGYLHFTYLWPLRTETLQNLASRARHVVLIEQNVQGQLGMLIRMECGLHIADRILKYDGRPFFYEELHALLTARLAAGTDPRAPTLA